MQMVTYPLNNIEYTAEDAELFHSTRTSGVYAIDSFDYSVSGADNTIVIGTGIAWIKNSEFSGKVVAQKEPVSIDIGLSDPNYERIDAIAIQFDANKNASEIVVKNGVPSSNPTAPSVVRTESIYELHLYHVRRGAGSLTISANNITDLRSNNNYCGLMTDSVTQAVDTTLSKHGVAADAAAVGVALTGKAPAGFGLGENLYSAQVKNATPDNIDSLKSPGWYAYYDSNYDNLLAGLHFSGGLLVSPRYNGCVQIFFPRLIYGDYSPNSAGTYAIRVCENDLWSKWCIENPPMKVGVEYRTTAVYDSKPVYSLVVDLGTLPNNGTKWVSTGSETKIRCLSITGFDINNGHSLPFYNLGTGKSISLNFVAVGERGIGIKSDFDASGYHGYAILKFTKKADG